MNWNRKAARAATAVTAVAALSLISLGTANASTLRHPKSAVAATAAPTVPPNPVYGVTVDNIDNATVGNIISAEGTLPAKPTTRVYFDVHEPASYYAGTVGQLHAHSYVMGELLDSSDEKAISVSALNTRVNSYLSSTLGSNVDIWETGNEINGNWTGPYATVEQKFETAYNDVHSAGHPTALTLFANEYGANHCGDGSAELTPVQYAQTYIPAAVRDGLNYVWESYYPDNCGGTEPTNAQIASEMDQLHTLFPNAKLGFGETGLTSPVTSGTLAHAKQVMNYMYTINPTLSDPALAGVYVGGYFWWNAQEDALTPPNTMLGNLQSAFNGEAGLPQ